MPIELFKRWVVGGFGQTTSQDLKNRRCGVKFTWDRGMPNELFAWLDGGRLPCDE